MFKKNKNVLINSKELQYDLKYLAIDIDEYLKLKIQASEENKVVIIGILNGSVHFVSDLTRKLTTDHTLEFIKVKSYTDNKQGKLKIETKLPDVGGCHVIIMDDICDTGVTLKAVTEELMKMNPVSINTCVLLDKAIDPSKKVYIPDWKLYVIDDLFVYGYGLDDNGLKRNLNHIMIKEEN